ncbi:hypothetical protein ACRE_004810 [Hapsidospora chrysogenum ATCC 11550]|uniref:Uncharacterized protein n=1 Tax=Hapsidospora chrysogenum (strain ATCC 11550 / CBS 779.69 / DSM 880 / IAM 14645 / JCM 23072 / IMI 49137) TaxID=857340 RepID=A0A086THC2_HAPC1|nr:hypothetical protein ACRE_004810 [Hapsidospora chrysogenum ATCC 11550]
MFSTLSMAVVAGGLVGSGLAMPFAASAPSAPMDLVPRCEDPDVLPPLTWYNGIGKGDKQDVGLYDQEVMYWGDNKALATVTCGPRVDKGDNKMLNLARLGDWVEPSDCSSDEWVKVKFKTQESYNSAKEAWAWVDSTEGNTVYVVVDGANCGEDGRQPYAVTHVVYDEATLTATLMGRKDKWMEFVRTGDVHFSSQGAKTDNNLEKRAEGTLNLENDFSKPIVNAEFNGVSVGLECVECKTTGALDYELSVGFFEVTAEVTTRNSVGASILLGLSISGELVEPFRPSPINFLSVPLTPFSILGIAEFSPIITVNGQAEIGSLTAELTTTFGGAVRVPDDRTLRLFGGSDSLDPEFEAFEPTIGASLELTASISPTVTLEMSARAFGIGATVGVALEAPFLEASLKAEADTGGGVCNDPEGLAGLSFGLDIGARMNFFAGFGEKGEQPNAIEIFSVQTPLVDTCLALATGEGDGDDGGDGGDGDNGGGGDENERPKVGFAAYSNGEVRDLFNFGALDDATAIPVVDGATLSAVAIDGEAAGIANCEVYSDFVDEDPLPQCFNLVERVQNNREFFVPEGTEINGGCLLCANFA